MVKKLLLVFCCAFGFVFMTCSAQQDVLTPYQKKVLEINIKYYCKIYYNKPFSSLSLPEQEIVEFELLDQAKAKALIYLGLAAYATEHSAKVADQLATNYENEIKAAKKLKNNVDLERERKEAMRGKDMGHVYDDIKSSFEKWSRKGEFEKEIEHEDRLKTKSEEKFISCCNNVMASFISNYAANAEFVLGRYDSEKETFSVEIGNWDLSLPIQFSQAETFKKTMTDQVLFNKSIHIRKDPGNFYCVNNSIYPKELFFSYNEQIDYVTVKYEATIPWCVRENINQKYEIQDVIFYFDDLGLENHFMNGSSYNYTRQQFTPGETMVKIRAEEEKRQKKIKEEQEIRRKNDSIFNAANNKLQNEIADYHSLLKRTPYNYKENSLSLSIPKFLIGENQRLTDTLKILIDSVNILMSQLEERYKKDSLEFRQMSQSLQDKIDEANVQFLQYPYNVQKRTLEDSLSISLFGKTEELAKELHAKVEALPKMQEQAEKEVYEKLMAEDPQRFTEIYFTQNPSKKQEADESYIECRCKYKERLVFDMAFIHNTLTDCDCREKEYQTVSEFFHSREDFDQMYSQEESTYKMELNKLKSMMADKKAIEEILFNSKQLNFKKSMLTSNEELKSIVNRINEHKGKYYYADVIDVVFKHNDKLAKEWEKNGKYFKSKAEMFEYWIGEEYDKVLKTRKKE